MNVEIREDNHGERGLFATKNIPKGKYICNLPIDYIKLGNKWYSSETINEGPINFRYGIFCDIPINNKRTLIENVKSLLKNEQKDINDLKEVTGVSNHNRTDGYCIGHMINDSVSMTILNKGKYNIISEKKENVIIGSNIELFGNRLGLRVTAKKRIKKDEELYFKYGDEYWKNYSNKQNYEIMPIINYF